MVLCPNLCFQIMMKDIPNLKVEDIAIAVVPRDVLVPKRIVGHLSHQPQGRAHYRCLVNSKGYGKVEGEDENDHPPPFLRRDSAALSCQDRAHSGEIVRANQ